MLIAKNEHEVNLIILFDAARTFDKSTTFDLIRNYIKLHPKLAQKELSKGYSRPSKLTDNELEKRLMVLFDKKGELEYAISVIKSSFFKTFYDTIVYLFKSAFSSNFGLQIDDRIRNVLGYITRLSGWPVEVVIAVIEIRKDLRQLLSKDLIETKELLPASHDLGNDFVNALTQNPVQFWRNCFWLEPGDIFINSDLYRGLTKTKDWIDVNDAVLKGDMAGTMIALEAIANNNADDICLMIQALLDLLLLGIDLNDNSLVSKTSQRVNEIINKSGIPAEIDTLRLSSTLAISDIFLEDYDKLLDDIYMLLNEKDLGSIELGFLGSLFCVAKMNEHASKFFFHAFRERTSPLVWPLHGLSVLQPKLIDEILHVLEMTEIPVSIDKKTGATIIKQIVNKYPNWDTSLEAFILWVQDSTTAKAEKEKILEAISEPEILHKVSFQLKKVEYDPELWGLIEGFEIINKGKENLKAAVEKSKYEEVTMIATKLTNTWRDILEKIETILTGFDPERYSLDIQPFEILQRGKHEPEFLVQVIKNLNLAYQVKRKLEQETLEKEKATLRNRIKALGLEHLWVRDPLSREDLNQSSNELAPHIERAERVRNLRKGNTTLSRFLEQFNDEIDRSKLVDQIVEEVSNGRIGLNRNITDIICSKAWEPSMASTVIERCICGMKLFKEKDNKINETFLLENMLPFIYKMAIFSNVSPLVYILADDFFGQLFTGLMTPDRISEIRSTLGINDNNTLMENLSKRSHNPIAKNNARTFLLRLVEFDINITSEEKMKLLSKWLSTYQDPPVSGELLEEIQVILCLRDLMVSNNLLAEAVILVVGIWRSSADDRVLDDFESGFFSALSQLIVRGGEGKEFVHSLLQNPKWLVQGVDGVLVYLYLCYLGEFEDLIESGQYNYFNEYKEVLKQHPVLVTECFFKEKTSQNMDKVESASYFDTNIVLIGQAIKEFNHGLQRLSSYKSWHPSADYQKFFNKRLANIIELVYHCDETKIEALEEELKTINPHEWIQTADKELGNKVKHQAHETMEKYIREQTDRLVIIIRFRKKLKGVDLEQYLEYANSTLKKRLENELTNSKTASKLIIKIYRAVLDLLI